MEDNNIRYCTICNKQMKTGFVINGGEEYFCYRKCLNKVYSDEEYDDLYEEGDSYWTEFE